MLSNSSAAAVRWATLALAHATARYEKIQIWLGFKGRGEKSQSLDSLALIKGRITASG